MRKMKDSGAFWMGSIPEHWDVGRIDSFYALRNTKVSDKDYPPLSVTKEGVLPQLETAAKTNAHDDRKLVRKGDFAINSRSDRRGSCGISPCDGSVSLINTILAPKGIMDPEYYDWLFHTVQFADEFYKWGHGIVDDLWTTNYQDMKKINIPVPPLNEQRIISGYLNKECAEIDALSSDIQSEIETLEAYKRSKVFDTVMHGLNHDRFIEVDSDVWTTIPEGWKLVDIKYLFEIVKRIAGKEGYNIIAITQQGLKYKDISSNEGQIASDYSGYQFVYPGDYAMNHMDLLTGWVDLSDIFGVTSPDYRVFRLRYPEHYDRKYYKYIMQCCYMNRIFYTLGQGVSNLGRWRLQTSAFNNFKVPVPPYEEQVRLGQYLENEISQINEIIAQKQEQLAVLADYKKSIIYEYVTGKKEVPVA